ncbi:hypothetical protein MMC30_000372 [Trapelia coarctata]|nr:hypothetical protein [Trapelia coarctata]
MAAEVYLARLYEQDGSTDDTIQELELATGQQDYAGRDNIVEPMKIDFMSVTKRLNNMCGVLGQLELRAEYQRHQLQKMILYMDGLLKLPLDPRRKERILQISRPLEEHVEYLASRTESVMLSIRDKQQTARTQLAVVYNFMGQRDNKLNIEVARDSKSIAAESKRDSSSMKTIAVLTIVFLPGTFVAALFSMPMFNWQADSTTAVVSPRFWVYWAITAPLTIVVVLIWFIWIALKDARHRREDLEMAQAYESDGKGKQKDSEEETSGRESSSASSRSSRSNAAVPRTGPSPKCQTNDADAEGHIEHSQHSGSRRSSRLSQQSRQTRLNRDQVSSEPTPAPPASGRKPWKVPRDLVLTSRALLGLSAPQEKQN